MINLKATIFYSPLAKFWLCILSTVSQGLVLLFSQDPLQLCVVLATWSRRLRTKVEQCQKTLGSLRARRCCEGCKNPPKLPDHSSFTSNIRNCRFLIVITLLGIGTDCRQTLDLESAIVWVDHKYWNKASCLFSIEVYTRLLSSS